MPNQYGVMVRILCGVWGKMIMSNLIINPKSVCRRLSVVKQTQEGRGLTDGGVTLTRGFISEQITNKMFYNNLPT